jgi:2'-5' RNA ligase
MPPPRRPLYIMAKPPPDVRDRISTLARTGRDRSPELLHMTLLQFGDLAYLPTEFVPILLSILKEFEADALEFLFDTIVERKAVTLRPSLGSAGRNLQITLMDFLKSRDFPFFGAAPAVHVTINYRRDGKGDERIDPIAWRVDEILLIESIHGEARHELRGRVPLR